MDKTVKLLLGSIAAGVWVNVAIVAVAQHKALADISDIQVYARSISVAADSARSVDLVVIQNALVEIEKSTAACANRR
jgi:hypothetical protein